MPQIGSDRVVEIIPRGGWLVALGPAAQRGHRNCLCVGGGCPGRLIAALRALASSQTHIVLTGCDHFARIDWRLKVSTVAVGPGGGKEAAKAACQSSGAVVAGVHIEVAS